MKKLDVYEKDQYFESIFSISNEGIVFVDHDGIILRVNPAFTKILGYEEHEMLGKPFSILAFKDQFMQKQTSQNPLHYFYSSEKAGMEVTFFDKQGNDVPVRFRSILKRDKHGQVKQAVGMMEHMIELTGTEEAGSSLAEKMWEAQQNFENVLEYTADAILICDISGNIMTANTAFLKLVDYTAEEAHGMHIVEFTAYQKGTFMSSTGDEVVIDEEYVSYNALKSSELFEKGCVSNWEFYLVKKDKVHVPVEGTMSVLSDKDGERRGSIVILRDITERKKTEEELREHHNKLDELVKFKTKELRESKEQLEDLIETSLDPITASDKAGTVIKANKAFLKMIGFSEKEVIGQQSYMFSPYEEGTYESTTEEMITITEKFFKEAQEMVKQLFEEGKVSNRNTYYKNKDNKIIPAVENIALLYNDKGERTGSFAIIRDITEQRKTERETKDAKEFLENIFRNSADGIIITSPEGYITMANKAAREMFDYSESEFTGKNMSELTPEQEGLKERGAEYQAKLFKKGAVTGIEHAWLRKDGSLVDIEINVKLLKDDGGNPKWVIACLRDITERKRSEKEHIRLSTALEQTHDLVKILGPDGTIQYINPATEKVMGYKREEIVGQNPFRIKYKKDADDLYNELNETISQGKVWSGRQTNIIKDGTTIELESTISPIRDSSGNIINYISISRDITKELKLEEQLQRAQKMEAIGTLAGGVAHDLNNILGAIVGYPDLLLDDIPEDSPMRSSILAIQESGKRAATIVHDLLTLARRGINVTEVVNLNNVVSEYLKSSEYKKLKEFYPAVVINTNLETDLLNIIGSPVHLSKAVMNLVSNATEALPEGGKVSISTANRYLDKPVKGYDSIKEGDYIVLTVSDDGIGISERDLGKIFEPFYTKKVMGRSGTGLGMTVVWGTVKDHKGYIDVISKAGEGTTFKLYFPVTRKELQETEGRVSIEEYIGDEEKILVIDDIESQRHIATSLLKKLKYNVEAVSSGEEAIEYMKNNSADLLLLDMIMDPGMDGFETFKRILEIHPRQKAIIASGFSETDRVKEAQKLGVGAYIKKPYTLEKIGLAVKAELEKQS